MPLAAVCTGVGALTIAGMPPFAIFDSEWMIFSGGFRTAHIGLAALLVFGSLLTVAYALWFFGCIFFGERPKNLDAGPVPWEMIAPTVFLAALALIEGIFPSPVFNWVANELKLILGGQW